MIMIADQDAHHLRKDMNTQHFRLIFKRSQTDTAPPTFSLLVVAEMSPAFIATAKHYGLWNQIVYADPKLKEARDLMAREAEAREQQRRRRNKRLLKSLDRSPVSFVLPAWLTYEILKLAYLGPIKLAWWIWCAIKTQRTQILRLRELHTGKNHCRQHLDGNQGSRKRNSPGNRGA